jgi:hypothetical protein
LYKPDGRLIANRQLLRVSHGQHSSCTSCAAHANCATPHGGLKILVARIPSSVDTRASSSLIVHTRARALVPSRPREIQTPQTVNSLLHIALVFHQAGRTCSRVRWFPSFAHKLCMTRIRFIVLLRARNRALETLGPAEVYCRLVTVSVVGRLDDGLLCILRAVPLHDFHHHYFSSFKLYIKRF